MIGDQRQHALAQCRGVGVLALLDAHLRQRDQRLNERRVLAAGALEDQRRFFQPARGPQIVAEDDRVFGGELALLVERAKIRDRQIVACPRRRTRPRGSGGPSASQDPPR